MCSKEMGEAGTPFRFVPRTDVVPDIHGDDLRRAIGSKNNGQAVGKGVRLDRDARRILGPQDRGKQHKCEGQQAHSCFQGGSESQTI